jgi:predicted O-linked N-acetylglucosamine transferase (SPINDLY family)
MVEPNEIVMARRLIATRRFAEAMAVLGPMVRGARPDARGLALCVGVLLETGQVEPAAHQAERLVAMFPGEGLHHAVLGDCRRRQGRQAEAAACYVRAHERDGSLVGARLGLARCWRAMGRHARALAEAERAAGEHPGVFEATALAATLRHDLGDAEGAVALLRGAAEYGATDDRLWRLLAFVGNSCASVSAEELAAWHSTASSLMLPRGRAEGWDRRGGRGAGSGRLRVGLLSPDLREHPVSRFLRPFLARADASRVEFVGYHLSLAEDDRTREIAGHCAAWRNVAGMPDEALAAGIAADGVDVLLDLAGFTNGGRPRVLSACPAGRVVSWIGYAHGLGMPGVVRLSDACVEPESAEVRHIEGCFLADEPPAEARERRSRRSSGERATTLGCFASMARLTPATLDAWSAAMRGSPGVRLLVKNEALGDAAVRERLVAGLAARGVSPERVECRPRSPTRGEHYAAFDEVDVALDTFPYNGTTTTCDALAMGVPVVTARGGTPAGRVGESLLRAAGLGDAVAPSLGDFAGVVARWVSEGAGTDERRAEVRARVERSRLHDTALHARLVVQALEEIAGR